MKKTVALAAVMVVLQIGAAQAAEQSYTEETRADGSRRVCVNGNCVVGPPPPAAVTSDTAIFASVEGIEGEGLSLRLVHTVASADGAVIWHSGDEARAILDPVQPGATRRAACVVAILGKQGEGRITGAGLQGYPRQGCLAYLLDFEGRAGLPINGIRAGMPARIKLNGDLRFEVPR